MIKDNIQTLIVGDKEKTTREFRLVSELKLMAGMKRKHKIHDMGKNATKKKLHKEILGNTHLDNQNDFIENLTDIKLSDSQYKVLSRGLSFIPNPEPTSANEIQFAFERFRRRLHLKHFFSDKGDKEQPPFHTKSNWEPPVPENENINTFLLNVYEDIMSVHCYMQNLFTQETVKRELSIARHFGTDE